MTLFLLLSIYITPLISSTSQGRGLQVEADTQITVTIGDNYFTSQDITITAGDRVTWNNQGQNSHTVTDDGGSWGSGTLLRNQSFSHTFTVPGTYEFHCEFHAEMKGKIIVIPVASTMHIASATPHPSQTPGVSPVASPSPSSTPFVSASPVASTTWVKLCKYSDDNANSIHENGESVQSGKFTVFVDGETARVVESHWWNVLNQGCVSTTIPVDKTITVEEEVRSGWRLTGLYADGILQNTNTHTYVSRQDEIKVLWYLNTFTPAGGVLSANSSPSTANIQPECVSLSGNPTSGGARLIVNLTGKGRDLDGIIRDMEFNFGDGEMQKISLSGETNRDTLAAVSHTYNNAGTYNANIRVKDNSGQSNEWSTTPESCKVKIEVQGTILGGTTTTGVSSAAVLPKSGVSEWLTISYILSAMGGISLKSLGRHKHN